MTRHSHLTDAQLAAEIFAATESMAGIAREMKLYAHFPASALLLLRIRNIQTTMLLDEAQRRADAQRVEMERYA